MNNLPRQKLREIITKYGRFLCEDPRRCEALLRDFCGEYKREINLLVLALKEGIASELQNPNVNVPNDMLLARFVKRHL